MFVSGEGQRAIVNIDDITTYIIVPLSMFERISVVVQFEQCEHGCANMAFGLTSRTTVHSSITDCDNLWYDTQQTVMLHLKGLNVSQGEFHADKQDLSAIVHGDLLTFYLDNEYNLHLKVNDSEYGHFSVGPGRTNFCAELRWGGQSLKIQ